MGKTTLWYRISFSFPFLSLPGHGNASCIRSAAFEEQLARLQSPLAEFEPALRRIRGSGDHCVLPARARSTVAWNHRAWLFAFTAKSSAQPNSEDRASGLSMEKAPTRTLLCGNAVPLGAVIRAKKNSRQVKGKLDSNWESRHIGLRSTERRLT
jgi:hypothetical protein